MLTLDTIKQTFDYDPTTGVVRRIKYARPQATLHTGTLLKSGYINFIIWHDGRRHGITAHRIAWMLSTDAVIPPDMEIDHRNTIKNDNRLVNLRLLSPTLNQLTKPTTNRLGRGVYREGSRFISIMNIYRKSIRLGSWPTAEEAAEAYRATWAEWWGTDTIPIDLAA